MQRKSQEMKKAPTVTPQITYARGRDRRPHRLELTLPKLHCDLTFPCTQAKISPLSHPPENVKNGQRHEDLNLVGVGGDDADIDVEVYSGFSAQKAICDRTPNKKNFKKEQSPDLYSALALCALGMPM